MAFLDSLVLCVYFAAIAAVGVWFGRGEKHTDDYFLGGRRQPWLIVGMSILATELSALTFVNVPGEAFAGDCAYLQLFFGAFLGRLIIVWLLLPAFYGGRVTTVYEFLGQRFGPWTRCTASLLFFASRIIGSGLRLLAASIAVSVVFDWSLLGVIVGSAAVAIAYTSFGGIKAIVWTDALQATVFLSGAVVVLVFLFVSVPGSAAENLQMAADAGKLRVFNWGVDLNDDTTFLLLFINALFLNMAVFGTDQDLTQRMLTCRDLKRGQRSLIFSAVVGFPVVGMFLLVGVMLWAYFQAFPAVAPAEGMSAGRVFPYFIAEVLPSGWGLRGLLLAGVFAAAMSSLDSALGSLSSSAVIDFYKPYIAPGRSDRHYLRAGRVFSVGFGVLLVVVAIAFADSERILWKAFSWAGLIFGSLLGIFLLAVLTRRRGSDRFNPVAMLSAIAVLAVLKFAQDENDPIVAWPWWIVIGTVWTFALGALFVTRTSARAEARGSLGDAAAA